MRTFVSVLILLAGAQGFAPGSRPFLIPKSAVSTTARSFGIDPSAFHDIAHHVDSFKDAFTSLTLSDVDPASVLDAAGQVAGDAASNAVDAAAEAADAAADANSGGWFGFLTGPIEGLLQLIHTALVTVGVSADAWGVSIIALTVLIKILTFPLTKTQLESTNKMQAMQPAIKELQAKYQSNPEVMNQKVAEFYQANDINPLAGCIPSLVQIPVFIGLYRAVLTLAKENRLDEPFLWLPNLEGPTYGADPTHGSDWILQGWTDAGPSLGWDDTAAFLILPVFLVVSQFVSMQLMQPKQPDGQENPGNFVLKLLPLMIGWFSLNVPAALTLYWVTNNIITTATSLVIRNSMKTETVPASASSASVAVEPPKPSIFAPPREKPSGFGDVSFSPSEVKPITPVDVEIVEEVEEEVQVVEEPKEPAPAVEEVDDSVSSRPDTPSGVGMDSPPAPKKGKKRGKKRRKRKN